MKKSAKIKSLENPAGKTAQRKSGAAIVPPAYGLSFIDNQAVQKKPAGNHMGLPDDIKQGVENLSGLDMSDVAVNYNSSKPAQLNALAYAQGNQIHISPAQEKHLPHEAWHVVQQKQGRVKATAQMKSVAVNDEPGLEEEADVMGKKAVQQVNNSNGSDTILKKSEDSPGKPVQLLRKKKKLTRAQKKAQKKKRKKKAKKEREFAEQQPWRVWHKSDDPHGGGHVETKTGIPPSTYKIPARLFHVTSYASLPSIQKTGLDPNFVNNEGGLNASSPANLPYRLRDAALKTVYLGSSSRPGLSMSSEEDILKGGKITLIIKVPRSFVLAYMRYSAAVGAAAVIDDNAVGDTVVSFARIRPQYIFVSDPGFHQDRCITNYPKNFDWRQLAMPPAGGTHKSLPSLDQLRREKEKRLARLEAMRNQPQPEFKEEARLEDEDREEPPGLGILGNIDIPVFDNDDNNNNNNDSDSEWSD